MGQRFWDFSSCFFLFIVGAAHNSRFVVIFKTSKLQISVIVTILLLLWQIEHDLQDILCR